MFAYRLPRSGVTYHPTLEWRLAARWAHYRWEDFTALDGDEQAYIVATYRCYLQIEAVVANAMRKKRRHGQQS